MRRRCVRGLFFIVAAALLASALAEQDILLLTETRLTICATCSCLLGAGVFALCSAESTAPWIWPIIREVAAASLAYLWFGVYKAYFAAGSQLVFPVIELAVYASMYFFSCFVLYMLRSVPVRQMDLVSPLSKLCGMFCKDFGTALLCYALELSMLQSLLFIAAEQLIFYAVWLVPRTFSSGIKGWSPAGIKLLLPGFYAVEDEQLGVRTWREHCDSIAFGGCASTVLCYSGLSILQANVVGNAVDENKYCDIDARCAWHGEDHGIFWACTALTLVAFHFAIAPFLGALKKRGGLCTITGFVVHGALTKAGAMAGLNFIRHFVFEQFCWWCHDGERALFANLMIMYASLAIAMLEASALALFSHWLPEAFRPAMVHVQQAAGLQAAKACEKAFSTMSGSKVMTWYLGEDSHFILACSFTAILWPVYVAFLRPAVVAALRRDARSKSHRE